MKRTVPYGAFNMAVTATEMTRLTHTLTHTNNSLIRLDLLTHDPIQSIVFDARQVPPLIPFSVDLHLHFEYFTALMVQSAIIRNGFTACLIQFIRV